MRFSALFQHPVSRPPADDAQVWVETLPAPDAAAALPPDMPDDLDLDLDARVRLMGEWQLLEG